MYIDTHCHLNFGAFKDDWRETADAGVASGVKKMILVGADLDTSAKAVELAQTHPALYAAIGIHPHHTQAEINPSQLEKFTESKKVVAIGECGLDYHLYKNTKYPDPKITPEIKNLQKVLFGQQIKLAKKLKLPLIIHNREAGEDTLDALKHFCLPAQAGSDDGIYPQGVFHCISGSKKLLQKILAAGFYIGVDANITYSQEVQTLVLEAPLDKILLETDSPWLTPLPDRNLRNTPQSVKITSQTIAKLKNLPEITVAEQTTKNAKKLFNL